MARIAGVNIPTNKPVAISLRYIYGIGPVNALEICDKTKIDPAKREPRGLEGVLRETFPIEDVHKNFRLEYIGYNFGEPKYTTEEAMARNTAGDSVAEQDRPPDGAEGLQEPAGA